MRPPFPAEHGVWAMLGASFVLGSAVAGGFTFTSLATAIALAFLLMAKAPLTVVLRKPDRTHARWLGLYLFLSGAFLCPLLASMPPGLFVLSAAVMLPSLPIYLVALWKRREMKIPYEVLAMALLALSAAYAYASAGGSDLGVMASIWGFVLAFFAASSFRVRSSPSSRTLRLGLGYNLGLLGIVGGAVAAGLIPPLLFVAYVPLFEDVVRAIRPRKEPIAYLGRLELAKTLVFLLCLSVGFGR